MTTPAVPSPAVIKPSEFLATFVSNEYIFRESVIEQLELLDSLAEQGIVRLVGYITGGRESIDPNTLDRTDDFNKRLAPLEAAAGGPDKKGVGLSVAGSDTDGKDWVAFGFVYAVDTDNKENFTAVAAGMTAMALKNGGAVTVVERETGKRTDIREKLYPQDQS